MLLEPIETIKRKPGIVTIWSGPRRVKMPPADIIIDVASFMVDDWEYIYNGTEPIIQNTLYSLHEEFIVTLAELIITLPVESGVTVVLSCEAGERRSVAAAELLARELHSMGIKCEVYHKGLAKWFKF
jgi:RNase adaptor protein for sRNA GlmZ degradation